MTSLPPARWSVVEKKSEGIYTSHPCQHSNPSVALALRYSWSRERNKKRNFIHAIRQHCYANEKQIDDEERTADRVTYGSHRCVAGANLTQIE